MQNLSRDQNLLTESNWAVPLFKRLNNLVVSANLWRSWVLFTLGLQNSYFYLSKWEKDDDCARQCHVHTFKSLPAWRVRCGGRGPPRFPGKPPSSVVVSDESVAEGGGGATYKRKSQGKVSNCLQRPLNSLKLRGGPCVTPSFPHNINIVAFRIKKLLCSHFRQKR